MVGGGQGGTKVWRRERIDMTGEADLDDVAFLSGIDIVLLERLRNDEYATTVSTCTSIFSVGPIGYTSKISIFAASDDKVAVCERLFAHSIHTYHTKFANKQPARFSVHSIPRRLQAVTAAAADGRRATASRCARKSAPWPWPAGCWAFCC